MRDSGVDRGPRPQKNRDSCEKTGRIADEREDGQNLGAMGETMKETC